MTCKCQETKVNGVRIQPQHHSCLEVARRNTFIRSAEALATLDCGPNPKAAQFDRRFNFHMEQLAK